MSDERSDKRRRKYRRAAMYPVRIATTVSAATYEALCEWADAHEESVAGVVRSAVEKGMKAMRRE